MNFIDLFSGIGGFRQGMETAGHRCIGFVEWDKYARQSYEAIYETEGEWTRHDITKVTNEEWRELKGKVDVICGGFPCQAFSAAGKRRGFEDTRGTMFFEIARAAKEIKPQFLLLENVKGILNHDKGRTFRTILSTLDELGFDVEWNVCNSKWFGLPQNRERTFIIASSRKRSVRKFLPIRRKSSKVANERKVIQTGNIVLNKETFNGNPQRGRIYSTEGISPCLNTCSGGGLEPKIAMPVVTPDREKKRQNGRRIKNNNEEMFTLTAQDRHGVAINEDNTEMLKIRKLTPLECWRLQGFPDDSFYKAEKVNSNSQLYKQAGNSVSPVVVEAIAKELWG